MGLHGRLSNAQVRCNLFVEVAFDDLLHDFALTLAEPPKTVTPARTSPSLADALSGRVLDPARLRPSNQGCRLTAGLRQFA